MAIRFNKRSCFYLLLTLLCFLLMARYSFSAEIPRIVLTAVVVAMAMIGDKSEILAILMGCIPMHNAVDFYICIAVCALILAVKYYDQVKVGFSVILVIVTIIWEVLHCFAFPFTLQILITSLIPFVFIALLLSIDIQGINYAFIVRLMAFLASFMCLVVLMNYIIRAEGNLSAMLSLLRRLGHLSEDEILYGGAINPNSLGIINVLCMTALLQLRPAGQQKKLDMVLIFVLLLFGVLTLSRTFLVCLLTMFVLVLWGIRKDWKRFFRILGGTVIVSLLLLLVTNWLFPEVISEFVDRFQVDDITTGRGDLMSVYHDYIIDHPKVMFFGIGLSNLGEKLVEIYRVSWNVPHNSIQEMIIAWGIPGLLLMALLIFVLIYESKQYSRNKTILHYAPLVILLVKSMAGQLLTSGYTLLALAFAFLSLCQEFNPVKELDESALSLET